MSDKIKTSTCKCACCGKTTNNSYHPPGEPEICFCSTDCAIMGGRVSIRKGWINPGQPINKCEPKRPWWKPDDLTYDEEV